MPKPPTLEEFRTWFMLMPTAGHNFDLGQTARYEDFDSYTTIEEIVALLRFTCPEGWFPGLSMNYEANSVGEILGCNILLLAANDSHRFALSRFYETKDFWRSADEPGLPSALAVAETVHSAYCELAAIANAHAIEPR